MIIGAALRLLVVMALWAACFPVITIVVLVLGGILLVQRSAASS